MDDDDDCRLEYEKEGSIRLTIPKVDDFLIDKPEKKREKAICRKWIAGIEWCLEAELSEATGFLIVHLVHRPHVRLSRIRATFRCSFEIINQKGLDNHRWYPTSPDEADHMSALQELTVDYWSFGTDEFIHVDDLLDPEKGHTNERTVIVEAYIDIVRSSGVQPRLIIPMSHQTTTLLDTVLEVSDGKIAVNRSFMALASTFMKRGLFDGDRVQLNEALSHLNVRQLTALLRFLYPEREPIRNSNIHDVLVAAKYLHVPLALKACDDFLDIRGLQPSASELMKRLHLAFEYPLPLLQRSLPKVLREATDMSTMDGNVIVLDDSSEDDYSDDNMPTTSKSKHDPKYLSFKDIKDTREYQDVFSAEEKQLLMDMYTDESYVEATGAYMTPKPGDRYELALEANITDRISIQAGYSNNFSWQLSIDMHGDLIFVTVHCNPGNLFKSWFCKARVKLQLMHTVHRSMDWWTAEYTKGVNADLSRDPFVRLPLWTLPAITMDGSGFTSTKLSHDRLQQLWYFKVVAHIQILEYNGAPPPLHPLTLSSTTSPVTDMLLYFEDGRRIAVNKAALAMQSDFFNRLFYGRFKESNQEIVPIFGVRFEDFLLLLSVVYPSMDIMHEWKDDGKAFWLKLERLLFLADTHMFTEISRWIDSISVQKRPRMNLTKLFQLISSNRLYQTLYEIGYSYNTAKLDALMKTGVFKNEFNDSAKELVREFREELAVEEMTHSPPTSRFRPYRRNND